MLKREGPNVRIRKENQRGNTSEKCVHLNRCKVLGHLSGYLTEIPSSLAIPEAYENESETTNASGHNEQTSESPSGYSYPNLLKLTLYHADQKNTQISTETTDAGWSN